MALKKIYKYLIFYIICGFLLTAFLKYIHEPKLAPHLRNFFLSGDVGAFVGVYFISFVVSAVIVGFLAMISTIVFALIRQKSSEEPLQISLGKYTLGLLGVTLSLSTLFYTQFIPFYPTNYWLFYILIGIDIVAFLLIVAIRNKNKWLGRILAIVPILIISYIAFGIISHKDVPKTLKGSPFTLEFVRQYRDTVKDGLDVYYSQHQSYPPTLRPLFNIPDNEEIKPDNILSQMTYEVSNNGQSYKVCIKDTNDCIRG